MNGQPDKLRPVRQWIAKAENDLRNAVHTLTIDEECPFDTICFHAQQCAEKYLKGYLVLQQVAFPRTHDLVVLLRLASGAGLRGLRAGDVQPLNRYIVEARYPGDWDPIDRNEAEQTVAQARKVREAVRAHLPEDLID
jgi:HEPN domain-containing protein